MKPDAENSLPSSKCIGDEIKPMHGRFAAAENGRDVVHRNDAAAANDDSGDQAGGVREIVQAHRRREFHHRFGG